MSRFYPNKVNEHQASSELGDGDVMPPKCLRSLLNICSRHIVYTCERLPGKTEFTARAYKRYEYLKQTKQNKNSLQLNVCVCQIVYDIQGDQSTTLNCQRKKNQCRGSLVSTRLTLAQTGRMWSQFRTLNSPKRLTYARTNSFCNRQSHTLPLS